MPADGPLVTETAIHALPERFRESQSVFNRTGGMHAAGLFDAGGNILALREDVGRHNAVDKLIGAEFLAGRLPLGERGILVSGRASFELMQKAAHGRHPHAGRRRCAFEPGGAIGRTIQHDADRLFARRAIQCLQWPMAGELKTCRAGPDRVATTGPPTLRESEYGGPALA